jgi:hypothetical protein
MAWSIEFTEAADHDFQRSIGLFNDASSLVSRLASPSQTIPETSARRFSMTAPGFGVTALATTASFVALKIRL